jgi:membrane fusion protein (multidrug efflux system)
MLEKKVLANGSVLPSEEVELHPEVSGKITGISFKEGTRVKKGDLLVKINDAELKAQLLKSSYNLKLAEDKEYRQRILLEKEGISRESYDAALNETNTIKADIELIKAQIAKTEIKAPFDGVIGLRYVSEGSYVGPSTRIATMQSNNPVKIDFAIPQKYYESVKSGSGITFKLPGSSREFSAKIYAIEPKIDMTTRTLQIRALCPNPSGELMPGAYIEIDVTIGKDQYAAMVPSEAVMPDFNGEKVFLYKSGKAMEQIIETGLRTESRVEIISGLKYGDTLISSGIIQLKNNLPVTIAKFVN